MPIIKIMLQLKNWLIKNYIAIKKLIDNQLISKRNGIFIDAKIVRYYIVRSIINPNNTYRLYKLINNRLAKCNKISLIVKIVGSYDFI